MGNKIVLMRGWFSVVVGPFVGAPIECVFGQNLDNFLTNVQVLSSFCPMFVKVLSMSNICQKNFNFTKFCQIIVHILSKNFGYCPSFV